MALCGRPCALILGLLPTLGSAVSADFAPLWSRVEADGVVHWVVDPQSPLPLPQPQTESRPTRAAQLASLMHGASADAGEHLVAVQPWTQGALGWSAHATRAEPGVVCLAPAVATDIRCVFADQTRGPRTWSISGSYATDAIDFGLSFRERWLSGVGPDLGTSLAPETRWIRSDAAGLLWQQRNIGFLGALETGWGRFGVGLDLAQVERAGERIDQGALSLSWLQGPFGGVITGQVAGSIDAPQHGWGGLDLGVFWRTPWSGTVAVGAKNLVTTGEAPRLPIPRDKAAALDRFERMPYVRYEQDL